MRHNKKNKENNIILVVKIKCPSIKYKKLKSMKIFVQKSSYFTYTNVVLYICKILMLVSEITSSYITRNFENNAITGITVYVFIIVSVI